MSTRTDSIGIVGFACDFGGSVAGSYGGPSALRSKGLLDLISALGISPIDYGNVTKDILKNTSIEFSDGETSSNNAPEVYAACAELYKKTSEVLKDGHRPLILGGDHSLSIGSVAAVADFYAAKGKKIGLLWVDAHPDINTPKTSPSGNFFGMSVAILLGLVPGALSSIQKNSPSISFENLSFIGLRDVDPEEKILLNERCPGAFAMNSIDEIGICATVNRALEIVTRNTEGFVLSFDLDACDPNFAPGTGTPKRGGLTYRESHYILERAAATKKMVGIELVEFNPSLDRNGETAEVALSLVESALGKTIL